MVFTIPPFLETSALDPSLELPVVNVYWSILVDVAILDLCLVEVYSISRMSDPIVGSCFVVPTKHL